MRTTYCNMSTSRSVKMSVYYIKRSTHRGLAYLRARPLNFNEPALCLRVARGHPGIRIRTYGNIYTDGGTLSSTGRLASLSMQ